MKTTWTAADDPKNLVAIDHQVHEVIDAYSRRDYERAAALGRLGSGSPASPCPR